MILRFRQDHERQNKLNNQKKFYLKNLLRSKIQTLNYLINFIKNYKYCTTFIFIIILNFINLSNSTTLVGFSEKQVWSYLKDFPRNNATSKCASSLDRVN